MKLPMIVSLAAATFVSTFYVACGGSSSADAFAVDAGDDGSTSGDAQHGDGAAAGGDAALGDDGSPTDTGAPRDGGSPFTDAAPAFSGDGGGANDAGPGGTVSQIACGSTSCSLATDFCCVYRANNPPPEFLFDCASGSGCPTNPAANNDATALACSSAANCPPSTVCCVNDNGRRVWSQCQTACTSGSGVQSAQLCDPTAATTGCPTSQPCSSNSIGDWGLPRGFATCGGVGN